MSDASIAAIAEAVTVVGVAWAVAWAMVSFFREVE
jgi:hypothetical protein